MCNLGPSAPSTGGQVELPRVVKASFSLYGVFLFCVVFWYQMCGGEVEYMKCIYNTISPHTFHEDVIFFFFFGIVVGHVGS